MYLAGTLPVRQLGSAYRRRWSIEVMFQCFKERGFILEATHLKALEKLKKLLALVSLAHGFCLVAGRYIDRKVKRIGRKRHGYKGQSYFRRGKDVLEAYLLGKPLDVVVDWVDVFERLQRWLGYQMAYFCPKP